MENNYVILYSNNTKEFDIKLSKNIKDNYNISIIKFLFNNEQKINDNNLEEVYVDISIEEILIIKSFCVICISNTIKSKKILDLLKNYNKYIIFNSDKIFDELNLFLKYFNNNDSSSLNNIINYSISNFEEFYNKNNYNFNNNKVNKNIKLEYTKILKYYENEKMNILTYYKNFDNNIINIIQKKCIIENLKNKYINKVIVITNNDNVIHLKDILDTQYSKNLIIEKSTYNDESYKDIFEIINKKYNNHIFCVLRSDIVLPNQDSLGDILMEFEDNENKIYCISRIERLINGVLIKYDKLNKIFYSTEQDAWIFKSPLNINLDYFKNIYFYEKFSELALNNILKNNNYKIINDSNKYKILRILTDNNIKNRHILNISDKRKTTIDNLLILPDNDSFNKVSIEQLIQIINLDEKELYSLKCEIFNKYLKKNIICNMYSYE